MATNRAHTDNSNEEQQPNNQLKANTLAQVEDVWGDRGQGELSFGEGPGLQIKCDIRPVPEKGLETGSLG